MAKKKNSTSTDLISYYMEYTLEHDAAPKSVYIFAKKYNFQEESVYLEKMVDQIQGHADHSKSLKTFSFLSLKWF